MTTTLERYPTVGSTLPRIFTPPRAVNCDKEGLYPTEHCPCGCGLHELTSWGASCIEFLERHWGWTMLPWQKFLYWHALEKRLDHTGFRFPTIVVLVGRQQGKTRWLKGIGLWRLFMNEYGRASAYGPAARLAVVAAQNLD